MIVALDEERLWLPANYNHLFLDLKDAAQVAESLPRCDQVLEGTIDLDESSKGKPIYRILCRQQDGLSYNELVDGTSFKALTTKAIETPVPTAEDEEARRIAEEEAREQARREKLNAMWLKCEKAISEKLEFMNEVQWLSELPASPRELKGGAVEFLMDFDAQSIEGAPLRYRARCQFQSDGEFSSRIYARR